MDRSAELRYGPFAVGDYREIQGRRFRVAGTTDEAASFTTTPIVFMDYRNAQELQEQLRGNTTYVLVKLAPGADRAAVQAELARRLPYNDVFTREEWAQRSRDYWVKSTGLGMSMGVTVFLGILVGIVIVAQTLYTSAVEHIKEFGTVKAIGGLEPRHLPHPRRAGAHRGGRRLRPGRRLLLRRAADHGRHPPQRPHLPGLHRRRVRGHGPHVPRLGPLQLPAGGGHRPRPRLPHVRSAMTEKVLAVENVTKVFEEGRQRVEVLKGITMDVAAGEVVALEGPSGSGKTTLLSIMGCILTPTVGRSCRSPAPRCTARTRARCGTCAAGRSASSSSSTTSSPPSPRSRTSSTRSTCAGSAAARRTRRRSGCSTSSALGDRRGFLPRDLSGGQKQRVAIARALAGSPPVLLADEPTANLDTATGAQVLDLFRDLAKGERKGLLIVTHDPKVRRIADRVVGIRDGRLVRDGADAVAA